MAFQRPTLPELIDRIQADIEARLPGADPRLRRSLLGALAHAEAGAVHGLHGRLSYLADQILPDSADAEHLERWADIWGVQRKAASPAGGDVDFTGTDGSVIPEGTTLQRADGREYTTDAEATISSGSATVAVTAAEAGAGGNADAGTTLELTSPIAGVDSQATVASGGITGGADRESDADLRARLGRRIRSRPRGGAADDYVTWALEVAGVTRAWVAPLALGPGTVTVRFMMDDTYDDGIPQSGDVDTVQAHIDEQAPVTALVTVAAPSPVALDPEIAISPDTTDVREAVEASLEDLLLRDGAPGVTLLESHIREAISLADGEDDHDLISPADDVAHAAGEIPVLGTITWQTL